MPGYRRRRGSGQVVRRKKSGGEFQLPANGMLLINAARTSLTNVENGSKTPEQIAQNLRPTISSASGRSVCKQNSEVILRSQPSGCRQTTRRIDFVRDTSCLRTHARGRALARFVPTVLHVSQLKSSRKPRHVTLLWTLQFRSVHPLSQVQNLILVATIEGGASSLVASTIARSNVTPGALAATVLGRKLRPSSSSFCSFLSSPNEV